MLIHELLETIKNTPGSNDKKSILETNMTPLVEEIFKDTYGPQKYYIKKFNVTQVGRMTIDHHYKAFKAVLSDLSNRLVTGNAAVALVEKVIGWFNEKDQEVLKAILDRNLKIGLSEDNFNKIIGESKFEVALAYNLDKVKNVNPIDGTYFASRKLDGCRTLCFINNYYENGEWIQEVLFKSRAGKPINTLNNLVEAIKEFSIQLNGSWVLDGETCIMEGDKENFNLLMREVTRKNHTIDNPRYCIFDILTLDEFEGRKESPEFSKRYSLLEDIYNECLYEFDGYGKGVDQKLKILKQECIKSQEDFDKWTNEVSKNGWEGFMLRKNIPYESGRTKSLLKVKKFQDAEYKVLDVITGKVSYNENGTKEYDAVTALIIEHKGTKVQVGSGLSKEQRLYWFEHPEDIVGKTATIQYFEETINKKDDSISLRFPVLKYVYDSVREV